MQKSSKKRPLGLWMLTALVAGNMIGSGIFLLPASLASFGSVSLLGWIFTAFGSLMLALVFATLSHAIPKVGGPYAYCREAYGDFIGFEVAYNYWIALWVGNGAIVVAFVSYLSVFFPSLAQDTGLSFIVSVATVWGLTIVNILGVRNGGIVQLVTTILKIFPLLFLATYGLFYIDPHNLSQFNLTDKSNFSALTSSAALTLWAFIGVESATVPADDVENPHINIPRATILGTLVTAGIYILSTIAIMGLIPMATLAKSSAPYADAAMKLIGPTGQYLVALGAIISTFGALNGWILLQGQVPYAAAKDDLFPPSFGIRSKQHTPIVGLLVSAILITALLTLNLSKNLVSEFTFISQLATLATLIPYILTSLGELIIFKKHPNLFNPKKLTGGIIVSILAFIYSYWAIIGVGAEIVYYGVLLLFSGIPVYAWMKWREHLKVRA